MAENTILIDNIEFFDETCDPAAAKVYLLADEQTASTIGAFSSEESAARGIAAAIENGCRPAQLWGTVYDLDVLASNRGPIPTAESRSRIRFL